VDVSSGCCQRPGDWCPEHISTNALSIKDFFGFEPLVSSVVMMENDKLCTFENGQCLQFCEKKRTGKKSSSEFASEVPKTKRLGKVQLSTSGGP
jgi:hypothetical protein